MHFSRKSIHLNKIDTNFPFCPHSNATCERKESICEIEMCKAQASIIYFIEGGKKDMGMKGKEQNET